jgi:RNA polymerase sigma-70 factor (sigma-E family)
MNDDREAEYAAFYAATWPRLFRTTYAVAGDRQLTEDALQTAFAHAWSTWARVAAADDRLAYVRRMAINAALARHRKASSRRESVLAVLPDAPQSSGEDAFLASDATWRAVLQLPPRQRAVVVLRYYEDLSEQEIADVLGCRPGTVKSQASAALASLRKRLGEPATEERSTR